MAALISSLEFLLDPVNRKFYVLLTWQNFCYNNLRKILDTNIANKKTSDLLQQTNELFKIMDVLAAIMAQIYKFNTQFHREKAFAEQVLLDQQLQENERFLNGIQLAYKQYIDANQLQLIVQKEIQERFNKIRESWNLKKDTWEEKLFKSNERLDLIKSNVSTVYMNIENRYQKINTSILERFPIEPFKIEQHSFKIDKDEFLSRVNHALKMSLDNRQFSHEVIADIVRNVFRDLLFKTLQENQIELTPLLRARAELYINNQTQLYIERFNNSPISSQRIFDDFQKLKHYDELSSNEANNNQSIRQNLEVIKRAMSTLDTAFQGVNDAVDPETLQKAVNEFDTLLKTNKEQVESLDVTGAAQYRELLKKETLDTSLDFLPTDHSSDPFSDNQQAGNDDDPFGAPSDNNDPFGVIENNDILNDYQPPSGNPPSDEFPNDPPHNDQGGLAENLDADINQVQSPDINLPKDRAPGGPQFPSDDLDEESPSENKNDIEVVQRDNIQDDSKENDVILQPQNISSVNQSDESKVNKVELSSQVSSVQSEEQVPSNNQNKQENKNVNLNTAQPQKDVVPDVSLFSPITEKARPVSSTAKLIGVLGPRIAPTTVISEEEKKNSVNNSKSESKPKPDIDDKPGEDNDNKPKGPKLK